MSVHRWPWPAVALSLLMGYGCHSEVGCPENGAPCGGDPSGSWNVVNGCRDPVFTPPLQTTYLGQPVAMARQPSPMMTTSDWCSSLLLGFSGVTNFTFPHDTLSLSGGQITYVSDDPQQQIGSYQATINTMGPGNIDLSPACLTRGGSSFSCDMVAAALTNFVAMKPANPGVPCTDGLNEPSLCQFYFSYQNIGCAEIPAGGCRCTYAVSFAGTFNGRWRRAGSVLTHSDTSKMLPSQADYCVGGSGETLSLSGHDRTSILNQAGIRTLNLQRATP